MKATHTLYLLFISLLCIVGFTACDDSDNKSDDMIWDFTPIELHIAVQDAQGNDLLNPETPGNIAKQRIKAIYKEKIYEKDAPVNQTKAYLAHFNGLQTMKFETGKYFLTFGEFNGDDTFDNEKVIIDWNDGTQDIITFSSKLIWKSKNKPVFDRKFYLNGKETGLDFGGFTIIKEPTIITPISPSKFNITDTRYGIKANSTQEILTDLQNNPTYPIGNAFVMDFAEKILSIGSIGKYTLLADDSSPMIGGTMEITNTAGIISEEIATCYKLMPPDDQIYGYIQWEVDFGDDKRTYNAFIVRRSSRTRSNVMPSQELWIYEDLTNYYQAKCPNSEVKEVVRLQISNYSPIKL